MGVLGVALMVVGTMAVVSSVNGRLPLVLAALFGQAPPIAPSYNSIQQQAAADGWTGGGAFTPEPGTVGVGETF